MLGAINQLDALYKPAENRHCRRERERTHGRAGHQRAPVSGTGLRGRGRGTEGGQRGAENAGPSLLCAHLPQLPATDLQRPYLKIPAPQAAAPKGFPEARSDAYAPRTGRTSADFRRRGAFWADAPCRLSRTLCRRTQALCCLLQFCLSQGESRQLLFTNIQMNNNSLLPAFKKYHT